MSTETVVRERPILFSGPMVRALLDGRKTQTRRVVTVPLWEPLMERAMAPGCGIWRHADGQKEVRCPYGAPGGRLWVRETWALPPEYDAARHGPLTSKPSIGPVCYGASYDDAQRSAWPGARWRPSIHMPRWASRLTLEITDVRVQRVQEISEDDARAEGIVWVERETAPRSGKYEPCGRDEFRTLWDSLNAARGSGWDANPWVWALTFRRVEVET